MLTLAQELKLMALDHFSRATAIDEAARTLRNRYTHQMIGQSKEAENQQFAIGELIASTKLEPVRDKLIERGIELWEASREQATGTSPVREGSSEGSLQSETKESCEDRKGTAYDIGVSEHLANAKLST